MNKILALSLVVVFLVGAGFAIWSSKSVTEQPGTVNPTPTITLTPTPTSNPTGRIAAGYVAGHITIGPNCPGPQREGVSCPTPPEAFSSRTVIVYESNAKTVNTTGKIDTQGNYKIALGPGTYFVQISPAGIGPGEKKPVTIVSFKTTIVDFDIDTGMR